MRKVSWTYIGFDHCNFRNLHEISDILELLALDVTG